MVQKATFTHFVFVYLLGGTSTTSTWDKVLGVAIAGKKAAIRTLGIIFIVGVDDETKKKQATKTKNTLIVWWCISLVGIFFLALVIVDGLFSGVARVSTFSVWFVISYEDFATLYTWLGCFSLFLSLSHRRESVSRRTGHTKKRHTTL